MNATWNSRRANSLGLNGAISCDQPLAAHAGAHVLEEGGTAADAALAAAAVLSVVQPSTCGLGKQLVVLTQIDHLWALRLLTWATNFTAGQ